MLKEADLSMDDIKTLAGQERPDEAEGLVITVDDIKYLETQRLDTAITVGFWDAFTYTADKCGYGAKGVFSGNTEPENPRLISLEVFKLPLTPPEVFIYASYHETPATG